MGTISVSQLSKSYPGKIAVSGISFEIPQGRITGLLGPNGAGKTTTLKLLTGSLNPDQGRILYDGLDFLENKIEIQNKIGYLPESSPIYFDLTVYEYLSFMGKAKGANENLKERIDFVLSLLKLESVIHRPIHFLSKGFKQRVSLAGTLIQDPEYIILDEPSSGLDPLQISELKELIRTLGKRKTILFSSHVLNEVEDICDHILVLNEGKLIADSSIASLSTGQGCLILAQTDLHSLQTFFSGRNPTIQNIAQTGKSEDSFTEFRILSSDMGSEDIFHILKDAPFQIRSLTPEKNSLESVFESLTLQR